MSRASGECLVAAPGGLAPQNELAAEWRSERLRQCLRRELRVHGGQRTLAGALGVSRAVIRKFLEMRSIPVPANLEILEDWADDRPEIEVPLGTVGLALLVRDIDPERRLTVRRRLAQVLADAHAERNCARPEWISHELQAGGHGK